MKANGYPTAEGQPGQHVDDRDSVAGQRVNGLEQKHTRVLTSVLSGSAFTPRPVFQSLEHQNQSKPWVRGCESSTNLSYNLDSPYGRQSPLVLLVVPELMR